MSHSFLKHKINVGQNNQSFLAIILVHNTESVNDSKSTAGIILLVTETMALRSEHNSRILHMSTIG
jgi:hypothetical protein